jgi:hypothetical protein
MCISSSFSFILCLPPEDQPIDAVMIQFARSIFETLGKKSNHFITKAELVEYAKENIFGQGILNIKDIMAALANGISPIAAAESVNSSITN